MAPNQQRYNILILGDSFSFLNRLKTNQVRNFNFTIIEKLDDLKNHVLNNRMYFDLIVADYTIDSKQVLPYLSKTREYFGSKLPPVIIVSSNDNTESIQLAFRLGVLDYMVEPANFNELTAKIGYHLDDVSSSSSLSKSSGALTIDAVNIGSLTAKQIQFLTLFLRSPERIIHREEIVHAIWKEEVIHPKVIDVHIHNLRKKLASIGYSITSLKQGRWQLVKKE